MRVQNGITVTDLRAECYGPQSRWARMVDEGRPYLAAVVVNGVERHVAYGATADKARAAVEKEASQ